MELAGIATQYGSSLTRAERSLLGQLSAGMSEAEQDNYARNIKELAAAREVIKQLPDAQTTKRQNAMAKAAMLKERLKMLRQMIPFMSPSAAKSLKAELKQIAAQLASLQGESGNSGTVTPAPQVTAADVPGSEGKTVAASDTASTDTTDTGTDGSGSERGAAPDVTGAADDVKPGGSAAESRRLKEMIEEAKSLLKAVLAAAKRKQQAVRGAGQLRNYAATPDSMGSVTITV